MGRRWLIIQRNWKCEIFKGHFLAVPNARVSLHQHAALTRPGIVNGGLSVRQAPASAGIYPLFASLSLLAGWGLEATTGCVWVCMREIGLRGSRLQSSFHCHIFTLLLYLGCGVVSWWLSCFLFTLSSKLLLTRSTIRLFYIESTNLIGQKVWINCL